jgi:hypothetical protein
MTEETQSIIAISISVLSIVINLFVLASVLSERRRIRQATDKWHKHQGPFWTSVPHADISVMPIAEPQVHQFKKADK